MRILVTGARGFLGRAVAAAAAREGLVVRGVSRSAQPARDGIESIAADLLTADLSSALANVDVIIHAAAASDWQDTVTMTRRLLDAAMLRQPTAFLLISSLAVLHYRTTRVDDEVSENSPLESAPADRDGYARAKLEQERLSREWATQGRRLTIVRPGAVISATNLWTPRLGFKLKGRRWLRVKTTATLPLVHVEACAAAVVAVALAADPSPVVHLINANPPTQQQYIDALGTRGMLDSPSATIPYRALRTVASAAWPVTKYLPPLRSRMPGALVPARLDGRFKPLRFSTALGRRFMRDFADQTALDLLADRGKLATAADQSYGAVGGGSLSDQCHIQARPR